MLEIPFSNNVTQGAEKVGTPSLIIRSDGTPSNTSISLTNGTKLGLIQSAVWALSLTGYATCVIETIATPGEFKALAKDVTVNVRPAPGYHPFQYLWDWYSAKFSLWFSAFSKAPTP